MKTLTSEPDYEPLRAAALHPGAVRPAGMAQFLRGGMITWLQTQPGQTQTHSREISVDACREGHITPLSTLIATMIAEVLR